MPYNPLASLVGELIALPFVLVRGLFRLLFRLLRLLLFVLSVFRRYRSIPLQDKNRLRATWGAFALVACLVFAAYGCPVGGPTLVAAIAAFACLYIVVGVVGSRGATVDVMAVFWRCTLMMGCMVVLIDAKAGGGVVWSVAVSTLGATQDGLQQGLWECWSIFFGR